MANWYVRCESLPSGTGRPAPVITKALPESRSPVIPSASRPAASKPGIFQFSSAGGPAAVQVGAWSSPGVQFLGHRQHALPLLIESEAPETRDDHALTSKAVRLRSLSEIDFADRRINGLPYKPCLTDVRP